MKRPGRPRRHKESDDSEFGVLLKRHLQRVRGFTQTVLSEETGIAEKTISEMVKGKRIAGPALRRDLRDIIKALHAKKAIATLDEANALMQTIPAVSTLDKRDREDAAIIALFNAPEIVETQPIAQDNENTTGSLVSTRTEGQEDVTGADTIPQTEQVQLPETPLPVPETPVRVGRAVNSHWRRYMVPLLAVLVVGVGAFLTLRSAFLPRTDTCPTNGVTLYTDINYQGQCHTFGPGDHELALFGLEQNVSSIKNQNDAYHITLFDKAKNFYYLDKSMPILPAEWDNRVDMIHIEKHRSTSCTPGNDGISAFIDPDYSGGCLFITDNIPDLTPLNFDSIIVSIQFVGSYQNTRQLVIYKQPNYKDECGTYWQNQSDLLQCARIALSVRVLSFTPPTPIPTIAGTHYAGNVAAQASLSPGNAGVVVDGSLHTEWIGGHMVGFELHWAYPIIIHRVVVWDRKQSATDNNQINKLKLSFSDSSATGDIDMISQGPRCADILLPEKTITSLRVMPVDASGNNGFREIEVWTTTGPQYSNNTCVNKVMVPQTVPQAQ